MARVIVVTMESYNMNSYIRPGVNGGNKCRKGTQPFLDRLENRLLGVRYAREQNLPEPHEVLHRRRVCPSKLQDQGHEVLKVEASLFIAEDEVRIIDELHD